MSDNEKKAPARKKRAMAVNQVNTVVVGAKPLCFTISRYNDYKSYAWSRFYTHQDYGEIGDAFGNEGDPQSVAPLRDGYIYVYKAEGQSGKLWKAYKVAAEKYRELRVSQGLVNYDSYRGPERDHARIENYFPGEFNVPDKIYIVDSDIKLSAERLSGNPYSISEAPGDRGYLYQLPYSRMLDADTDPPSGAQILDNYRKGKEGKDIFTYDLQLRDFSADKGINLRRVDAFKEAERRNQIYRKRTERFQTWLNDEDRNKAAYIHQTIAAVIQRDSDREDQLNMPAFRQWKRNDTENYRQHFFPVHYALESLVTWLENPIFLQWLLDYNHSKDDDQQEAGLEAYVKGIMDLSLSPKGRVYLRKQFDDDKSFFNMATHIPEIRREYTDPAAHSNFAVEVRKVSNVVFAGLQEFSGLIVKDSGQVSDVAAKITAWAQKRGVKLRAKKSRLSRLSGSAIAHVDMEHLESWARGAGKFADSVSGRSIISFFEVVNIGIAIYGVNQAVNAPRADGYHSNIFFNLLNTAGATADLAAAGLLEKHTAKIIQRAGWASGKIYFLAVFSGLVDFVMGFRQASQELSSGDYDAAFGWAVFATGGVLVAIGGYMQVGGATTVVGSAGAGSIPGGALILVGFVLEAIGLVWVWLGNDDELDEWLKKSKFGERPAYSSLDREIRALNELMCKFEVDVDFVSDTRATIEIEPRLFTQDSTLHLTRLGTSARARAIEYIIGDSRDLVTGGAGHGEIKISPKGSTRAVSFERDGDRISKISVDLYGRQDIDAVSGNARLEVGPGGYLHGYETKFKVEKGFFE